MSRVCFCLSRLVAARQKRHAWACAARGCLMPVTSHAWTRSLSSSHLSLPMPPPPRPSSPPSPHSPPPPPPPAHPASGSDSSASPAEPPFTLSERQMRLVNLSPPHPLGNRPSLSSTLPDVADCPLLPWPCCLACGSQRSACSLLRARLPPQRLPAAGAGDSACACRALAPSPHLSHAPSPCRGSADPPRSCACSARAVLQTRAVLLRSLVDKEKARRAEERRAHATLTSTTLTRPR